MYRIGELAQQAQVSKRTIDYYTNLGLLVAERSHSNYRYYNEAALETLQFIERCKKLHMPLGEIKDLLEKEHCEVVVAAQLDEISRHMGQLEYEVTHILPLLDTLNEEEKNKLREQLSTQASCLIETLSRLFAK